MYNTGNTENPQKGASMIRKGFYKGFFEETSIRVTIRVQYWFQGGWFQGLRTIGFLFLKKNYRAPSKGPLKGLGFKAPCKGLGFKGSFKGLGSKGPLNPFKGLGFKGSFKDLGFEGPIKGSGFKGPFKGSSFKGPFKFLGFKGPPL